MAWWCWARPGNFRRFFCGAEEHCGDSAQEPEWLEHYCGAGRVEFSGDNRTFKARGREWRRWAADCAAVLLQASAGRGAEEILFDDFRAGENSRQPVSHTVCERRADFA